MQPRNKQKKLKPFTKCLIFLRTIQYVYMVELMYPCMTRRAALFLSYSSARRWRHVIMPPGDGSKALRIQITGKGKGQLWCRQNKMPPCTFCPFVHTAYPITLAPLDVPEDVRGGGFHLTCKTPGVWPHWTCTSWGGRGGPGEHNTHMLD